MSKAQRTKIILFYAKTRFSNNRILERGRVYSIKGDRAEGDE